MIKKHLLFLFCFVALSLSAQENGEYDWWNELHDWEQGDPSWKDYIIMAPRYLGPNALPVPEVKKGIITPNSEFEFTISNHFHPGDPTEDISAKIFIPFAKNKIAVEFYGVILEHYSFSEKIRDERFARDRDGKGYAAGDLNFSTVIQIFKDRKFPNTLLRFTGRTASATKMSAARYTDTPGYFFDLSFSRPTHDKTDNILVPFGSFGFYCWQTNDDKNFQNDAYMYAAGLDYLKSNWLFSASVSGYSGYKKYDKPVQLNVDIRKDLNQKTAIRFQYLNGFRDWEYKTIRFSFFWKFNPVP